LRALLRCRRACYVPRPRRPSALSAQRGAARRWQRRGTAHHSLQHSCAITNNASRATTERTEVTRPPPQQARHRTQPPAGRARRGWQPRRAAARAWRSRRAARAWGPRRPGRPAVQQQRSRCGTCADREGSRPLK
jgi:hypothetical protein